MIAHIGGFPVEETLASFGPVLLMVIGAATARLRACLRRPTAEYRSDQKGAFGALQERK